MRRGCERLCADLHGCEPSRLQRRSLGGIVGGYRQRQRCPRYKYRRYRKVVAILCYPYRIIYLIIPCLLGCNFLELRYSQLHVRLARHSPKQHVASVRATETECLFAPSRGLQSLLPQEVSLTCTGIARQYIVSGQIGFAAKIDRIAEPHPASGDGFITAFNHFNTSAG